LLCRRKPGWWTASAFTAGGQTLQAQNRLAQLLMLAPQLLQDFRYIHCFPFAALPPISSVLDFRTEVTILYVTVNRAITDFASEKTQSVPFSEHASKF
jgi:hypothetical protein